MHEAQTSTSAFVLGAQTPFWTGSTRRPERSAGVVGDSVWDFREAAERGVVLQACKFRWDSIPEGWEPRLKLYVWHLLNEGSPSSFVFAHGKATSTVLSAIATYRVLGRWRRFVVWLSERGISDLADVNSDLFEHFAASAIHHERVSRSVAKPLLHSISQLWSIAQVYQKVGPPPPWFGAENIADYLPREAKQSENQTPVIPLDTIAVLLTWARRYIENFSDDIISARVERDRLRESVKSTRSRSDPKLGVAKTWFAERVAAGAGIPSVAGKPAHIYIAAMLGISHSAWSGFAHLQPNREALREYTRRHPDPCPLDLEMTGTIDGALWRQSVDYYEVDMEWERLAASALVTIAYLSGMRLNEVLNLRRGCLRRSADGGHWVIRGRPADKTSPVITRAGGQVEWRTIEPAARAIAVLEKMSTSDLLFESAALAPNWKRDGDPLDVRTATTWLNRFASFCSASTPASLTTAGAESAQLTFRMFRRTLAHYIARQPGGTIALAVQYHHMRAITSEGYAARRRDGFPALLEIETARAAAEALADIAESAERTGNVTGAGASRIVAAATRFKNEFGGRKLTDREARRFLSVSEHRVFPNPQLFVVCNFDPEKALCLRSGEREAGSNPRLTNCQSNCGNVVVTDKMAALATERASALLQLADDPEVAPFLAERLRIRAAQASEHARKHDEGRS